MWDFSFQKSISIIGRTWPFLLLRVMVFGFFAIVFCVLVASGALIGHEVGPDISHFGAEQSAIFGTLAGFGLASLVMRILREYTLYLVKGGHIAIMGELLSNKEVPTGLAQVAAGARSVRENFVETSSLFVLDQLIKGVLKQIEQLFKKIGMFIPFLAPFFSLFQSLITIAITYVDEMILAHIMRTRPANAWRAGADALVIYAQNAKLMFKNAFWLMIAIMIFEVVVFAAIYFTVPIPDSMIMALGEDSEFMTRFSASIIAVMLFGLVFIEPFAVATMLQVFNTVAYTQTPDPEMERKLAEKSEQFRELRDGGPTDYSGGLQPAE